MTELERFNQEWNGHFYSTKYKNGTIIAPKPVYSQRGAQTQDKYEKILFSIWKHHSDWDEKNGFQIKCRDRTIYRVLDLAEKAGLLIKVGNYSVGRFTRCYKKNHKLFDMIFRDQYNEYGAWLNNFSFSRNSEYDIIHHELIRNIDKTENINKPYFDTKDIKNEKQFKKLNYDIGKLHILCDTMLPHYWELFEQMNKNAIHPDLQFISWLKFNNDHLPTGRPYSYFCSTLNRNKKHKVIDPSMEYRDDFLKRVGLPDYYEVYDINAEIPRINYLFHTGEWKDDNYDFYSEIINDYEKRMPDEDRIVRGKAGTENYYDSMKQLFMRIYFGKGSEKQSYIGYKDDYMKRNIESWKNIKKSNKSGLWFNIKKEDFYPYTPDEWYEMCCSVENICGKSIGNLVFWYAFFLETEVKIELLKRGKKVYNVYDGFYFNQDIKSEISEILKLKSEFIYNNYMKLIYK